MKIEFEKIKIQNQTNSKGIPSQVFFNHFFALSYHINCDDEKYLLRKNNFYNNIKLKNTNCNLDKIRKLLWNSWSTEYAFTLTSFVDNYDYYKFAMHWTFPQAYYSIYLCMTAFHETQGIANEQHEKSIKLFGNSVKDGHYPKAISFYCKGLHKQFEYVGLNEFKGIPKEHSVLSKIYSLDEAQIQIASFLKTTRTKTAEAKREKINSQKDEKFLTASGHARKSFSKTHWDAIYQTIPETTILNIMYRLRIKANYHDVETFINANIDFKTFHESLSVIVNYINFIHEAYICKAIGNENYVNILYNFPNHLNKDSAIKRYELLKSK